MPLTFEMVVMPLGSFEFQDTALANMSLECGKEEVVLFFFWSNHDVLVVSVNSEYVKLFAVF